MVLQDTWLFTGTIFDNLAYGKKDAKLEDVQAAAKAARIHRYIMSLPQGYDTVLDESGMNISQGQKQLLTIARAMLLDAKMLILDEATSNVDTPHGDPDPGRHAGADEGQDLLRHRPPAVHHPECRQHPGGPGRGHRGAGHPTGSSWSGAASTPACTTPSSSNALDIPTPL